MSGEILTSSTLPDKSTELFSLLEKDPPSVVAGPLGGGSLGGRALGGIALGGRALGGGASLVLGGGYIR